MANPLQVDMKVYSNLNYHSLHPYYTEKTLWMYNTTNLKVDELQQQKPHWGPLPSAKKVIKVERWEDCKNVDL